jgi:hypothetical protein
MPVIPATCGAEEAGWPDLPWQSCFTLFKIKYKGLGAGPRPWVQFPVHKYIYIITIFNLAFCDTH